MKASYIKKLKTNSYKSRRMQMQIPL